MVFKLFLDASVLAEANVRGSHLRDLLTVAPFFTRSPVECVTSEYAMRECLRVLQNPRKKRGVGMVHALQIIGRALTTRSLVVNLGFPTSSECAQWEKYVAADTDDAPILADAVKTGATHLVTMDKHLLGVPAHVVIAVRPAELWVRVQQAQETVVSGQTP